MIETFQRMAERALACLVKGEKVIDDMDKTLIRASIGLREIRDRRTRFPRPGETLNPDVVRPRLPRGR